MVLVLSWTLQALVLGLSDGLETQSLRLSLFLDPLSLDSWSQKLGTIQLVFLTDMSA